MELHYCIKYPSTPFCQRKVLSQNSWSKCFQCRRAAPKITKEDLRMQRFAFQLESTIFPNPVSIINTSFRLASQFQYKREKKKKKSGVEYALGSVQVLASNADQVGVAARWACCRSWSPCRIYEILNPTRIEVQWDTSGAWSIKTVIDLSIDFAPWHWLKSRDWFYCGEIDRERLRLPPL